MSHKLDNSFVITNLIFNSKKGLLTFQYRDEADCLITKNVLGVSTSEEVGEAVNDFIIKNIL